jgi:pyruvate/2-oxoacid:ferredoxin oxidoreductase beta subunit
MFPSYSASASVSHLDDYIGKLKKALSLQGLRFIELFSPCPESGFDPSNTIEVARLAVETGTWPLYEFDRGRFSLTYKPTRLEPVVSYLEAIGVSKTQEEITAIQERVRKKWKRLSKR